MKFMYKRFSHVFALVTLASLVLLTSCQKQDKSESPSAIRDVVYSLSPSLSENEAHLLNIKLSFIGDADGETTIFLGNPWADEQTPETRFRDISVAGDEAKIKMGDTNQSRIIRHKASASLTIDYNLYAEDSRNDLSDAQFFYAPVITADFIQIIGSTSLIVPGVDGNSDAPTQIRTIIRWQNLPQNWSSVLSPSANDNAPKLISEIHSSAMIAGNFSVIERAIGPQTLSVVMPGKQAFSKDDFADELAGILAAFNEAWKDEPTDYLVSLLPLNLGPGSYSFAGTALENAFMAAGTDNLELDFLRGFLAHEITHDWIPRRLGEFPENETDIYWFSEGFTDYFAFSILKEKGLITTSDLINKTNAVLREYYQSPARNVSSLEVRDGFWTNPDVERQPYIRGFLIASQWNAELSKTNKTLISALSNLKTSTSNAVDLPVLTNTYLTSHFAKLLNRDVQADIDAHYVKGKTISVAENWFKKCASMSTSKVYSYDVGFDAGLSMEAGRIIDLDQSSMAYKAGVRENFQLLEKISGGSGDTTQPIVLKFADGTKIVEIDYFPVSGEGVEIPQFKTVDKCP